MARDWSTRSAIHRALKQSLDPQKGEDVKALQAALDTRAKARGIATIAVDGILGPDTIRCALAVGYALGALSSTLRKGGVTIGLQRIIRYPGTRTPAQLVRARQRRPKPAGSVAYPIDPGHLIADTWGYHPGVHDGVDLICPANETLVAICHSEVVRADAGGWWGLGAPADPDLRAKGDGIIILRSLVSTGPIRKGMNLCYGHAEHASVRVGDRVLPGRPIGKAGFANAWHVHFMVNARADTKGVGDRDPRQVLDYAKKESR